MNLILLLYPASIIIIVLFYVIFFMLFHNIYGIILCFLSIMKWISIKPIITWINNIIYERYKDDFDRIKQNIRETFIVKGNMTNTKQAIYLLHPHGICSLTHAFHINTDITNWPHRNVYSIISYIIDNFIPFSLDLINDHNHMITSKYSYMKASLQEGNSISMCLGNFTEGQYDNEHRITAIVKKRKGIFKMAIETGVPIIPVLSYGEQSVFKKNNTLGISDLFYKITGIKWTFPDISSMIEWLTIYKKPLDKKVVTHIGNPIEVGEARTPTSDDINELRTKYMEALRTLYKDTKPDDYEDDIVFV
jgi:hypothetical protein